MEKEGMSAMTSPKDPTAPPETGSPAAFNQDNASAQHDEIPLRLAVGDVALVMGTSGVWELEHSPLQDYLSQIEKLKEHNEKLEKENAQLKERNLRLTEESNMEKFKCQLLVEMLALSSLDEERSRGEAELERRRVASMQTDLQSLLDEARKQGVDVRKLGAVLSAP